MEATEQEQPFLKTSRGGAISLVQEIWDVLLNAGIFVSFMLGRVGAHVHYFGPYRYTLHPLLCAIVCRKLLAAGAVQADGPAGR